MKVGIFTPYLDILGGGERYILTAAEYFLSKGAEVNIFWDSHFSLIQASDRFNLNLTGLKLVKNIFDQKVSLATRIIESTKYDLIIVLSDGSIPISMAKNNWLHLQFPLEVSNRPKFLNKIKLLNYQRVFCNSDFTKKLIDPLFSVNAEVIYPPVDVSRFRPGKKEKIILSVGRFFAPSHPKRQDILIKEFKKLSTGLPGWRLVLLGGIAPEHESRLEELSGLASGLPVEIISRVDSKSLEDFFAKARIYWHATGYGADLTKEPIKAEHFGITTVEAMAAGAVPIVFAGGGQLEIVEEGKSGLLWRSLDELREKTLALTKDPGSEKELSARAQIRAKEFSKEKFFQNLALPGIR